MDCTNGRHKLFTTYRGRHTYSGQENANFYPDSRKPRVTHFEVYPSLTCVDVGVLLHVGLLVESLAAVLARVGPRVRVDELEAIV